MPRFMSGPATPDQVSVIGRVADRYRCLRLVIDHLAMTLTRKDTDAFASLDDICPLTRHPNVAVKVTALPCYTTQRYLLWASTTMSAASSRPSVPSACFGEPTYRGSPVPIAGRSLCSPGN